ncbi:flavodoxin family protein [Flaviaesturariibacter flavus]|uniref:Flavodoxin family protein n=2 Tax=Flaviaesturariibacter flavus TaxID=2502780 RepID=A0A4R1B8C8_9BACT|nr:flavodoxin family protein [Flaviaesturariibacter flavus]
MTTPQIAIIYYSRGGHTQRIAEAIKKRLTAGAADVLLVPVAEVPAKMEAIMEAQTLIFRTPTNFGNVAAPFKEFMDSTGAFWYKQAWKNKLAAGFTVSSTTNGDKLHTFVSLALFAAQHSMVWIPLGVLPRFINDQQTDGQNRLASYWPHGSM